MSLAWGPWRKGCFVRVLKKSPKHLKSYDCFCSLEVSFGDPRAWSHKYKNSQIETSWPDHCSSIFLAWILRFFKNNITFFKTLHRFCEKSAPWWKHRIRIAAPHFRKCFGRGWVNFNTKSMQTLSFWRFVASQTTANHDGWHGFNDFSKKNIIFFKKIHRFCEKSASWANNRIRIAAPHCKKCFGRGWVNFNTKSMQTLSFWRLAASRKLRQYHTEHQFSELYENLLDFQKCCTVLQNKCAPEHNI